MYTKQLNYDGDLNPVLARACAAYKVGDLIKTEHITDGYEDFNVKVQATGGDFVAKIFSHSRTAVDETKRLLSIYQKLSENQTAHPRLCANGNSKIAFSDSGLEMIFMDFIDGESFYKIGPPNDAELQQIIGNVADIHRIEFSDLPFQMDSWAVQNRHPLWNMTQEIIRTEYPGEYDFLQKAIAAFDRIPYEDLPHAFCHGDVSRQNTLRRKDGKIFMIDFSCANIYPRIHDFSVITTELMYGNGKSLYENCDHALNIYSKLMPLADIEREYFRDYVGGAIATLFMNPVARKHKLGDDSEQSNYFIENALSLINQLQNTK